MSKMSNNGRRKSQNKKMSIHVMFNHVTAHRSETWKRWLRFFQVAIRFYPGRHRKPRTQTLIISSTGVNSFYIELKHYLRLWQEEEGIAESEDETSLPTSEENQQQVR